MKTVKSIMWKVFIYLTMCLVLTCHSLNTFERSRNLKIINGSSAKLGQFPSLVSLQLENGEGHFCGGTIINPSHVLSAAHCIVAHNKDDIENNMIIIAGDIFLKNNKSASRQERYPELIILHSFFNEFTLEDDAAIIRTTNPFIFDDFVHPCPLSKAKPYLGTICVIAGWGVTTPNGKGPVSNSLLYANVYVVDGEYCEYSSKYKFKPDKMICGAVLGGGTDVCTADSGGPFFCDYELKGIISRGILPSARPRSGTTYSDVAYYRSWMDAAISWDGKGPFPPFFKSSSTSLNNQVIWIVLFTYFYLSYIMHSYSY